MATQDPLIKAGNEAAQNLPADLQANASIPAGQPGSPWVLPNPSVAVTTPQTIPAEQVANASPLPLVQQPINPPAEPIPAQGTTKTIDQYIQDMTPATPGKYGTEANSLLDSLSSLMPELKNKGADTITAENQAGLPQMNTELRGLQNELQNDYIELQRSQKNIMASGLDRSVATAQQRQDYENRSFDYNLKLARANAMIGNITYAQQQVDRAIQLKYSPLEQEYDFKVKQLQLIQPFLTAEENKIAKAAELKIQDERQALQDKKDQETKIQNLMIQAAQSGADSQTIKGIQNAKTIPEAISIASNALGNEFRMKVAQQEFDNKIKQAQLAISQANLGLERDKLNYQIQKDAYDEAVKEAGKTSPQMQQSLAKANIDLVDGLTKSKSLNAAVGPTSLARGGIHIGPVPIIPTTLKGISGGYQEFVAGVEQLRSQLDLKTLINAKAQGATFGALSEGEMRILDASSTKIGQWAIKDKNGKVVGYNANEKDFRRELDKINNFAKLDYVLKGGNPDDVGMKAEANGKYTVRNSDGSITEME